MKRILLSIASYLVKVLMYGLRLCSVNPHKIIIENFEGKSFGDNPKYVVEELLKTKQNYVIYWVINRDNEKNKGWLPKEIKTVKRRSISYFYHFATAKIWLSNTRLDVFLKKRNSQKYIQTWHGFGPKRVEKDVEEKLNQGYLRKAKHDAKIIDLMISSATKLTEIYRQAFWYEGEIAEIGSPRNDVFKKDVAKIKEKIADIYPLNNRAILLYAPTFRADGSLKHYSMDFSMVQKALQERFGKEWVIFLRLHPNISEKAKELNVFSEQVLDVSSYPDMQELLHVADILITDYSSSITDYMLTNKPAFIYATDIDAYKADRDFYFPLEEMASVSTNNQELMENIRMFDEAEYLKKVTLFKENMGIVEELSASKKIVQQIDEWMK